MLNTLLNSPASLVQSRLLNKDAIGLVFERLDQKALADLGVWYAHRAGGNRGRRLGKELPLLDAWLEFVEPEIPASEPNQGLAQGAVNFAAGLVCGLLAIDEVSVEPLFPAELDLDEALVVLGSSLPGAGALYSRPPFAIGLELMGIFQQVFVFDPSFHLVHRAIHRQAVLYSARSYGPGSIALWPRLHFFAGLVAAGVGTPSLAASRATRNQPDTRLQRTGRFDPTEVE
jgi:hypothetical protein